MHHAHSSEFISLSRHHWGTMCIYVNVLAHLQADLAQLPTNVSPSYSETAI